MISVVNLLAGAVGRTGITPTAAPLHYSPGYTYGEFLRDNGLDHRPSNIMSFAMLDVCQADLGSKPLAEGAVVGAPMVHGVSDADIASFVEAARLWVPSLISCYQVQPMSDGNYLNFFKSMKADTVPYRIPQLVGHLSGRLGSMKDSGGYAALVASSTFIKYHTAATSTPTLCIRAMDLSPISGLFTDVEIVAIRASDADLTSLALAKAIPQMAIIKTCAVLKAVKIYPDAWVTGNKAMEVYAAIRFKSLVMILERTMDVQSNVEAVGVMVDVSQLRTKFSNIIGSQNMGTAPVVEMVVGVGLPAAAPGLVGPAAAVPGVALQNPGPAPPPPENP